MFSDVLREEGGKKTIVVRCVDYGHLERVNEVWELDPQNTTLPAQVNHQCDTYSVSCIYLLVTSFRLFTAH